jgi:hypothetical protein
MPKQSLTLKSQQEFNCLAGDCPDHCCGQWLVILSRETIEHWKQIEPPSLREHFMQRIVSIDVDGKTKQALAKNENNDCANLTDDGLCELQSSCGHDMLPGTCQDFPRLRIENEWRIFDTTELSCPEIARLLVESDACELIGQQQSSHVYSNPVTEITRSLDDLFNLVYAENKYPLNIRIYYLGSKILNLLQTFEEVGVQPYLLNFPRKQIRNELYQCRLLEKNGKIKVTSENAKRFWKLAIEMLGDIEDLGLPGIDRDNHLVNQIFTDKIDTAALYNRILDLRSEVANDVRLGYRPVMEKYVPVLFMNRGLPWNPVAQNLIATFINAAIPLALVHLLLWINYRSHSRMDSDFLQQVIYKIERRLKHTTTLYDRLEGELSLLEIHRNPEFYLEIA